MRDRYDVDRMFHNENVTGEPFLDTDGGIFPTDEDTEADEARDLRLDPQIFCDERDSEDEGDSDY